MKAAILERLGTTPVYKEILEPKVNSENEVLIEVKAAAVKNLDKGMVSGSHYASYRKLPTVVGTDGVGLLPDGTWVYAQGKTGMLAEKAIVDKISCIPLPDAIEWGLAAALPNAALGGVLPLTARAKMKKGDVVLINGGTGITGKLALQMAKHYGASEIIITGRIEKEAEELKRLGAGQLVSTDADRAEFRAAIQRIHTETQINVVIDYLWGEPLEDIIQALSGEGLSHKATQQTVVVTVGNMAGATIHLPSGNLRSANTILMGSGFGSLSEQDFHQLNTEVIPLLFDLAAKGELELELDEEKLEDVEKLWNKNTGGKRLVFKVS